MALHPVEDYLRDLGEVYRTGGGVAEESYYSALENLLLNETARECNGSLLPVKRG
jgi:hypothetical protein